MDLQEKSVSVSMYCRKRAGLHHCNHSGLQGAGVGTYSSICVAQITNFPAILHLVMSSFWARATFSDAISIPKSPEQQLLSERFRAEAQSGSSERYISSERNL